MTDKFVRCESCKAEIPAETCSLASYSEVIDGKQYVFCCEQCACRYKQSRGK